MRNDEKKGDYKKCQGDFGAVKTLNIAQICAQKKKKMHGVILNNQGGEVLTVREFLKEGRRLNSEILELTEARIKAFNSACGGAVDTSGERVQTSKQNSSEIKFSNYVQYGMELEERIRELNRYRQNMLEIINRVDNSAYRSVLIAYYINDKTWEQVADDLHYSLRTIYRLHNKALLECNLLPSIKRQQTKNI